LNLVGLSTNAFGILAAFVRQAKKEGWERREIEAVTKKATRGNYEHLLRTIMAHCEEEDQ